MIEYMNGPDREHHRDHSDQADNAGPAALSAPPPVTEDPARHVGEIFRRLTLASETFPGAGFARIVAAVLVALGRAALDEAERQAARLRERTAPAAPGIRVSATARRVDFDGLDIDRPE
ncbi:hypothetical protein ABS772_16515 [Methylorubrum podarium]|uniref:Uncharacterized protein n=1 Tax=Methylorubrum podarium TaxID=200476 RepID=A0ABV1QQ27_9HYPH